MFSIIEEVLAIVRYLHCDRSLPQNAQHTLRGFGDRSQFTLRSIAYTECPLPFDQTMKLTKERLKQNWKTKVKEIHKSKKGLPQLVASVPLTSQRRLRSKTAQLPPQ
jgi:hypothetical protein